MNQISHKIMEITRTSQFSGFTNTSDLPVTEEQMERFDNRLLNGEYVQNIFPNLSQADIEFILTGATQEEWDEIFPKDDEVSVNK